MIRKFYISDSILNIFNMTYIGMKSIDIFRCVVALLHAMAAIASLVICFACTGAKNSQNWMVPFIPPPPPSNSTQTKVDLFRSDKKWNDSVILGNYFFNPYLLIMVFQWITASFSLFHSRHLWIGIRYMCISWYF